MLHMEVIVRRLKPCISKLKMRKKISVDQKAFESSSTAPKAWPYSRLSRCSEKRGEGEDYNDVPNGSERSCSCRKEY